ncbi:MAG TPA: Ni/Fe hydrogenase subunit alpha, partial [Campylobacterales bacterium]|nr:Ni/Fe hydrogenase subunit alpha [Campylobacterales bacterium]
MKKITIDPVTRIEGHAKITIDIDDAGNAVDAKIHVTQFRGFEKFCQGRPFGEMPSLMARTCGICPVSHLVSGAKAGDGLLSVKVPKTGANLRRIMNLAQIMQSHSLNFFHLSSPDILLGFDADPKDRNIFYLMSKEPAIAKMGIGLRAFGQGIIELLGKKRIHPAWIVPGGVNAPLDPAHREEILSKIDEKKQDALKAIELFKSKLSSFPNEIAALANFDTLFMSMIGKDGELDHYDGKIKFIDAKGATIAENLEPSDYQSYIGEKVEDFSFMKSPYYLPYGLEKGVYRVGPLARLNIAKRCGTPLADKELGVFKSYAPTQNASFFYHYARLIEVLYCIEKIEELLNEPDILSDHVRAVAKLNEFEAVGMSEAPRGTLLHHYKTDKNGLITYANLIIATGNNNLAMNAGITQAAKAFVKGDFGQGALNRVEAVIRAFDPCLSCATHAQGKMGFEV